MKRRNICFYLSIVMLIPAIVDARVLFSDWGMSPNALMSAATIDLKNKSIACDKNCSIIAEYMIFNEKMGVSFWFDAIDRDKASLKEIWLDSRKFDDATSAQQVPLQKNLFASFKELYTRKFGEPSVNFRDDTMKLLGIATYFWLDRERGNAIYLENWMQQVRLKYKPVASASKTD